MDPIEGGTGDRLDPKGEAEWERLRSQIELAVGFWLGFVFSASPRAVAVLRERAASLLQNQARGFVLRAPAQPEELRGTLPWLLASGELAVAGCTWIEAIYSDFTGVVEQPWTRAWEEFFLRANEHRDALRGRLTGGLVFAAVPEIKPLLRDAAPDLWSVRDLVIDLKAQPAGAPTRSLTKPALEMRRLRAASATPTGAETARRTTAVPFPFQSSPDPKFAVAEAGRRAAQETDRSDARGARVSRGHALLQAAEGFLAEGRAAKAWAAAKRAHGLICGHDLLGETRALWLLAEAEEIRGDLVAAAEHVERAIAVRRPHAPDEIPIEWYDMAGRLSLARGDPAHAAAIYAEAESHSRRRASMGNSVEALEGIAVSLNGIGDARRVSGDLSGAVAAFDEAVIIARRLRDLSGDVPKTLRDLAFTLSKLGDARYDRGDFAGAAAAFEEALSLARRLCTLMDAAPEALRFLSIQLNRIGRVRREIGDLASAAAAFDEALAIRRRVLADVGESPQGLQDISSSLHKIGEIRLEAGDLTGAAAAFDEALSMDRRLGS